MTSLITVHGRPCQLAGLSWFLVIIMVRPHRADGIQPQTTRTLYVRQQLFKGIQSMADHKHKRSRTKPKRRGSSVECAKVLFEHTQATLCRMQATQ